MILARLFGRNPVIEFPFKRLLGLAHRERGGSTDLATIFLNQSLEKTTHEGILVQAPKYPFGRGAELQGGKERMQRTK